jgi:NAD(P)-dependent dehydrogenase (short-subunit alcohol dehydrogenase family)/acyl carrier protein
MTQPERAMIVPDGTLRCDGRCEIRLLESLQKAIGDILSDHARSIAGNARSPIEALAGKAAEPAIEQGARPTNGGGLQTDNRAQPVVGGGAQASAYAGAAAPSHAEVAAIVVDTIAEITRYPREILTPEARFDDDLGIDSLKRAEIVTALLNRFGEVPSDLKAFGPMPLTLGEMTDFAATYFSRSGATPASSRPETSDGNVLAHARVPSEAAADVRHTSPLNHAQQELAPGSFWETSLTGRLFEGRVVLVTGSGNGLSKILAQQMVELGAHVIVASSHPGEHGEDASREIRAANGQATEVADPSTSTDHIDRVVREIEQRFNRLDYYVHNASDEVVTPLDKVTEKDWQKAFRSNIVAYHLCAMRAAKLMQKSGGGRIVAISSPGARRYLERYGVIGAVKAALETLTMYLAQELGPHNIQVNALAAWPNDSEHPNASADTQIRSGGRGNAEKISDALIFLLTPAARNINGATVVVDGGWSLKI